MLARPGPTRPSERVTYHRGDLFDCVAWFRLVVGRCCGRHPGSVRMRTFVVCLFRSLEGRPCLVTFASDVVSDTCRGVPGNMACGVLPTKS